jgi:CRISPR-associated protein Cas1
LITHAAISVLADHGCLVAWCGEAGVRFYAVGMGETRSAANFLHQARAWADADLRLKVVHRLYQLRFAETFDPELTLRQIRGMEGVRVRDAYARAARETGVPWSGRNYRRDSWSDADPVNRALSVANSCLFGICQRRLPLRYSRGAWFHPHRKVAVFRLDVADLIRRKFYPAAFLSGGKRKTGWNDGVRSRAATCL